MPRAPRARTAARRAALAFLLLAALAVLASGCGKKAWPTPQDTEHDFAFTDVSGENRDGCLMIRATVTGAWRDLEAVYLEYGVDECPGCPFTPERGDRFVPGDGQMTLADGALTLRVCGLEPTSAYRFRLTGVNVVGAVADVQTPALHTN